MSASVDLAFAALGDPMRRAVVGVLRKGACRPSELAEKLSTTRPAISRHLRVLRQAGIVREDIQADDGRVRMVALCREPFVEMRVWLDEVEQFWADQLAAFKSHAERRPRGRKR